MLLRKLTVPELIESYYGFNGTIMFITVFITARHWLLSQMVAVCCVTSSLF